MGFNPMKNTGIYEFAVKRAIVELQEDHDMLTANMIADYIGCSAWSVHRATKRLLDIGSLERVDGSTRAGGYRYRVAG